VDGDSVLGDSCADGDGPSLPVLTATAGPAASPAAGAPRRKTGPPLTRHRVPASTSAAVEPPRRPAVTLSSADPFAGMGGAPNSGVDVVYDNPLHDRAAAYHAGSAARVHASVSAGAPGSAPSFVSGQPPLPPDLSGTATLLEGGGGGRLAMGTVDGGSGAPATAATTAAAVSATVAPASCGRSSVVPGAVAVTPAAGAVAVTSARPDDSHLGDRFVYVGGHRLKTRQHTTHGDGGSGGGGGSNVRALVR
jgi:hypothetical protein